MTVWDPRAYLEFADERSRPFVDLLSRVHTPDPKLVVDLGCGSGQLTASLAEAWPAEVRSNVLPSTTARAQLAAVLIIMACPSMRSEYI